MNSATHPEIEKDLVRWPRAKWVTVILVVLVIEGAFFLKVTKGIVPAPTGASGAPRVTFSSHDANPEFSELQAPTLFAGANVRGFTGAAWLRKQPWLAPAEKGLSSSSFLGLPESFPQRPVLDGGAPTAESVITHVPPVAEPGIFEAPASAREETSRVYVDGSGRQLIDTPALPTQYASDALKSSIVQVLIEEDGVVFSARLLSSSGSKAADTDALNVARKARFERAPGDASITTSKMIFEWRTLDPVQAPGKSAPPR